MPPRLWVNWLLAASAGVALFGLTLVIAPEVARQGFSLLLYAHIEHITTFGEPAVSYVSLAHAVLGSVLFGWGAALVLVVRGLVARGSRVGWRLVAFSVAAWFVPDTAYSLSSGFWQNAVLNLVLAVLFAVPLVAIYRACNEPGA